MHVLMFAMGSAGDIHPFAGIGQALRKRGHRVTFVANSYFEPVALESGLEFIGSGSSEEYLETLRNPDLWQSGKGFKVMFEKMLDAMTMAYELIASLFDRRTIVAAPSAAFGARLANEKLGVPLVSVNVEVNIFRSEYEFAGWNLPKPLLRPIRRTIMSLTDRWLFDPALLPRLNAYRAKLGLRPITRVMKDWLHSPQRVIGLWPDWFAARQPDWPAQVRLTGFPLFDRSSGATIPPDLDTFLAAGDLPLVFTLGTAMRFAKQFFAVSAEACRLLNRRGILLTQFGEQVPERLPDGVRHFAYVPFSTLLPRAAALVHHGGIGTVSQALRAGTPQLLTPLNFDQPGNAARVKKLGAGDFIRPRDYTSELAARKLDRLLGSSAVADACQAVAAKFEGADPLGETCDLIEAEMAIHQPGQGAAHA